MRREFIGLLTVASAAFTAKKREWKEGYLVSVEMKDFMTGKNRNNIEHRYICTVADAEFRYVVEYEKPLKIAVNDKPQLAIEKDWLILLDADGKERSARIEQRARI